VTPQAPGRQRRWSLALLAVLITLGSALAFVLLWINAGERKPVLALARTVPAGQVIVADDLTVVRVSADPQLDPVPSSERQSVIGKTAGSDLVKGSLLTRGQLTEGQLLEPGKAIVALTLAESQMPTGVRVGDQLEIVLIPPKDPSGYTHVEDAKVLTTATVFGVSELVGTEQSMHISLVVDASVAPQISVGNAVDLIRLTLVPAK